MLFIVIVWGNEAAESADLTSEQLAEMGRFNEELAKAGVLVAAKGLHPTSKGARIRFEGTRRTVIDGPFTEAKEVVAGYWLIELKDLAEAIEWFKRCPNPNPEGVVSEVEIRQVGDADDFGPELAAEFKAYERRIQELSEHARKATR